MATDGSQTPEWRGQAFPYLLHHPNQFNKTETYGNSRNNTGSQSSLNGSHFEPKQDRTGTWNGPAPRGYTANPTHASAESTPSISTKEPETVVLPGGARMPLIGLGTYKLDSPDAVRAALSAGYRHIDCASVYGNEAVVGDGLKDYLASGSDARASLWITSKVWNDAHRPAATRASVERSIADLGCGYLDLVLVHWPHAWVPGRQDEDTCVTLKETWGALECLVNEGLVRYLGVSNFGLTQLEGLLGWAKIKPVVNQVELHPLLPQRKLVGVCARWGVNCVAYSPLGHSKSDLLEHPEVLKVAEEVGRTAAQVLLRWNAQRGVAVIPKAGSAPHLEENIAGLFTWRLNWNQKAALDALDEGRRFVAPEWHRWEDEEEGGATKPSKVLLGE